MLMSTELFYHHVAERLIGQSNCLFMGHQLLAKVGYFWGYVSYHFRCLAGEYQLWEFFSFNFS